MEVSVSVQEKKDFLQWFLQDHPLQSHEMTWFLQDLMEDERILDYVHFVEHIEDCPKGIIITKQHSNDLSFLFFKGKVKTKDVYTAYHELHLYQHEKIYIQVNFPEKHSNMLYQIVLEAEAAFQDEIQATTNELLDDILYKGKIAVLKQKINHSLERKDYTAFMDYSNQLKSIQKM